MLQNLSSSPGTVRNRPIRPFVLGGIVVALSILASIWDWDWFRPLVERKASAEIGRNVTMSRFDIRNILTGSPTIVGDNIAIGNPADFPDGSQFGSIDELQVGFNLMNWLSSGGKQLVIPNIIIDHPAGDLRSGPNGDPNWSFGLPKSNSNAVPAQIGELIINNGDFQVNDPKLKADFHLLVHTEQPANGDRGALIASARGRYAGQPISADFKGGAVLSLRDASKPYPIDFRAQNGATKISLIGSVRDPMKFAGANIRLALSGADLSDLYPILGIPLAQTPPYHFAGNLDYRTGAFQIDHLAGTVGQSDVEGNVSVTPGRLRPLITANLTSRRVVMSDLGGFIGGAPGTTSRGESPAAKAVHTEEAKSPNLFPDIPLNLPKLRAADFDVSYRGAHFENKAIPMDNIETVLTIRSGQVLVHPLNFGVGTGSIRANIALDARGDVVHLKSDIDFRQVDFHRLMQSTGIFQGAGVVGGRAELEGNGNSLAKVLADGNGSLKLFMTGGDVSNLIVDLAGLDFGRSILSLLGIPQKTNIRCMVSDFGLNDGLVTTNNLVIDTGEADIIGKGTVNLRTEMIDYQITQDPKHLSIAALHAPIDIHGMLKKPSIGVEPLTLAERAGAAVVLGVVIPGLGALIPTIQLGLGKDNDCATLIAPAVAATKAPRKVH